MEFDYHPRDMAIWDPWFVVRGEEVHLFHQQGRIVPGSDRDPVEADSIGHAVSRDLIHWEERPSVLRPDPAYPLEDLWAWTGCAVAHEDRFYMYYTMRASAEEGLCERLGVALSEDCDHWTRYAGNPLIVPDERWYLGRGNAPRPGRIDCRDLSVAYDEASGYWYGFFATRVPHGEMPETSVIGAARSRDLLSWEQLPPAFAPGTYGTVEVPEVFPLDGRWYLTCLTGHTHGNRPPLSDPHFISGTMYAVADRPEGPYRELPGDNVLYGGGAPCPHSCRSVLFAGERYVISAQDVGGGRHTLSPPMIARALPDGRLRLAYSPRTAAWRRATLIAPPALPPVGEVIPPLGHWCPLLSGAWQLTDGGYVGESRTGWQVADLGVGAPNVELTATLTLHSGVAAGLVFRPLGIPDHNVHDVVIGLDAAAQTAFAATLPYFMEHHQRRFPVQTGQAYRLRISLRFPRLELYVDDLLALQCALSPRDFATPSLGLFVDRGVATVSELTACELGAI